MCIKEPQLEREGRRGTPMKLCTQEMSPCTVTERHPLPLSGSRQATPHCVVTGCRVKYLASGGLPRCLEYSWCSVACSALCATGFRKWLKHTNVLPPLCVGVGVGGGGGGGRVGGPPKAFH